MRRPGARVFVSLLWGTGLRKTSASKPRRPVIATACSGVDFRGSAAEAQVVVVPQFQHPLRVLPEHAHRQAGNHPWIRN